VATAHDYYTTITDWQYKICLVLGVSLPDASMEVRAVAASQRALLSVLVKALIDKGAITGAEITAAWDAAKVDPAWQQLPKDV
jgi:hypothetical protein